MSLLAPWFLWGALAIAAPVIFHLIRKSARDRMPFSSLMFLRPTPPRVTRKPRLENWLLLLLRCLCLLLLALAFSRPFFAKKAPDASLNAEEKQIILLVDSSASMRREGVWEKAISVADKYIKKTTPADQLSIVTFDRQPHALFSFTEWTGWAAAERPALAKQRLQATSPGWLGTQLGLALTSAAEKFMEDSAITKGARSREIVLISDLQEGAKLDGLQGHDWPAGVKVIVERIDLGAKSNAGIGVATDGGSANDASRAVRVRVTNAKDSNVEKFRLSWEVPGKSINPTNGLDIYLPAGQTRAFSIARPEEITHFGQITLTGDEVDFDNKSYYAEAENQHLKVAWLDAGPANDPEKLRYYIDRVFLGTERREIKIISPETNAPISPELLKDVSLAIIPGTLAADNARIVKDWLTSGKSALFIVNDAQSALTLSAITGLEGISASEAAGGFALLNEIDFSHPLFGAFSDPRFSDFSHIHFWKHRKMEFPSGASIRSLAKFDDGSPALAQIAVGKGTLLILASGWNPGDSQLAVSSKFPPFMQTLLDWSGSVVPAQYQFSTGDRIPSPTSEKVEWLKPDGKKESTAGGKSFEATDVPGIYTATFEGKSRKYAVNVPLDESKTTALSPDQLAGMGVPMKFTAEVAASTITQDPQTLQNSELEKRQKIWRWVILGVLVLTIAEVFLSGWLIRRPRTVEAIA
ncbi:MAG: hypothetical protein JWN25_3351 [Verrucomicrobiales bacterium]|nr:hypothetical protein [Verrucomicrobiales bacterium]